MTTETNDFNRSPILNSPYERPTRHWELELAAKARAAYDAKLGEVMT